ncbi:uncharacterized protein METZ01_LOCUS40714, partial [marine metagenome]
VQNDCEELKLQHHLIRTQKSASAAHKHQSCYSGLQVTGHR